MMPNINMTQFLGSNFIDIRRYNYFWISVTDKLGISSWQTFQQIGQVLRPASFTSRYMASGPVLPMVWEGLNVVKTGRVMLGETNPRDSAPGTIRGDFCVDIGRNIIHGSDSVESAEKEINLWFSASELVNWRSASITWVYEDEEEEVVLVVPDEPCACS
jgi:hypothetical protein